MPRVIDFRINRDHDKWCPPLSRQGLGADDRVSVIVVKN